MYGLQIRNDDEVSEISEYIGNLSGFDGQNFNSVASAEAPTGYGLSVDNQKIVLHSDDTYRLRLLRSSHERENFDGKFFTAPVPSDVLLLVKAEGESLQLYALDRVSSDDKKGQYGLRLDEQTVAPVQRPVSVETLDIQSDSFSYDPEGRRTRRDNATIYFVMWSGDLFLDFQGLKQVTGASGRFRLRNHDGEKVFSSYPRGIHQEKTVTVYKGIR
jgi:hypothetical protein|nr:MAG TPA: hypothetical protein [Herelleviridae sp.]